MLLYLLYISSITLAVLCTVVFYLFISKKRRVNELHAKTTFAVKADDLVRVEMNGKSPEGRIAENFNVVGEKVLKYKKSNSELTKVIAEKEKLEAKLKTFENSRSNLDLLTEIGKQITSCLTINEIAVKLFNNITSSMEADEVCLLISVEGGKKYYNVISGQITELNNALAHEPDNILNWTFENNREVFLNNGSEDYQQYFYSPPKMQNGANAESAIATPLSVSKKMIGAVSVLSGSVNLLNNFHLEFIRSLSSYVSVAIENAHLYSELDVEKQKSEKLLLNILPAEVIAELKEKGKVEAKNFDNVTVLFADFVNFTKAGENMSAQALVDELDTCFKAFDEITGRYHIEKIKTVGDAYLAVAGLPIPNPRHARDVLYAALEIIAFMQQRQKTPGIRTFEIRIGVHTGSVVAGIVGVQKFAYDIWGDTVNTASRMQQSSEPGRITISQTTYELVKDDFDCEYRGEINAKNKGNLPMYFVLQENKG